jgi:hypothetical protein
MEQGVEKGRLKPERFVPILERLRDLLLKHHYFAQADVAAELIDLAHLESPKFVGKLQIGGIWGSSGSVADIIGLGDFVERPQEEVDRDSLECMRLLIRLADEMKAHGISTEGSELEAETLRVGLRRLGATE